jgi:hypothetical protein
MKLSGIAGLWLCLCLIAGGCVSVEARRGSATLLMGFQPENKGIKDLDDFRRDLINVMDADGGSAWGNCRGAIWRLVNLLTWRQACILYRTSTDEALRSELIYRILSPGYSEATKYQHPFFYGIWTKEDILNLLGEPNQIQEEPASPEYGFDPFTDFIYAGEQGPVGDGSSGYILHFDKNGHYAGMIPAN